MEEETRLFLVRIANTISLILLWMMLNVLFGLYLELGFFQDQKIWPSIVYYLLSVGSLIWILIHLKKKWKL